MAEPAILRKPLVLIVDDSDLNRSILADILADDYDTMEAADGEEAIAILRLRGEQISLVLLDLVMPKIDGFGVLARMNTHHWIDDIPVIMISAESSATFVERTYDLGATDYIQRPFDARVVRRRVDNTVALFAKQKRLRGMVEDQVVAKEKASSLMVAIVSHAIEFRNGESGLHVLHVQIITELLLRALQRRENPYHLKPEDVSLIAMVSALHDIGKISIPSAILNKPGKLTAEEYATMQTHTVVGAEMLKSLPFYSEEPLVQYAYEICRWHHERYDGSGYPDGLVGEEIPLSAQVVALADVYDALTSERVYKPAYSHETAIAMIQNGDCGAFSPLLLSCFLEQADTIREELKHDSLAFRTGRELQVVSKTLGSDSLTASDRTLKLLERERVRYDFFASMSREIQFEYTLEPPVLTLSGHNVDSLGLGERLLLPEHNPNFMELFGDEYLEEFWEEIRALTPEAPEGVFQCKLVVNGEKRWHRLIFHGFFRQELDGTMELDSLIGKLIDIHEEWMRLHELKRAASTDTLTGLSNKSYAKRYIESYLHKQDKGNYALLLLDLDHFKSANDRYGHLFGDKVLCHVADQIRRSIRDEDLAARMGGDEFLIFLDSDINARLDKIVSRIYRNLCGEYAGFPISISMGVCTSKLAGENPTYESLFEKADEALYEVKRAGRGRYAFYHSYFSHEDESSSTQGAAVLQLRQGQVAELLHSLAPMFAWVRLVDVTTNTQFLCNEAGELVQGHHLCYNEWNQGNACEQCVAKMAMEKKGLAKQVLFHGRELYCHTAQYIEMDGVPFVLELVTTITEQSLHQALKQHTKAKRTVVKRSPGKGEKP